MTSATAPHLQQRVCQFLYREARLRDDRQWDDWLACYSPDVEYWMPAWDDDDQLTTDPKTQVSLIYYANRRGLEDRIYRLRTNRSSASIPEPRTAHFIANIEVIAQHDAALEVRYNWHTLSHRMQQTTQFFGTTTVILSDAAAGLVISRKRVVLKDDYINQVIDIYHV